MQKFRRRQYSGLTFAERYSNMRYGELLLSMARGMRGTVPRGHGGMEAIDRHILEKGLVTAMKQVKKKSVIPTYAVAALWIVRALTGKLASFGDIIGCVVLSFVLSFVLKLIFPDQVVEEPEKAPEQAKTAQKQPETKKQPEPQKQPEPEKQPEPQRAKSTGNAELDEVLRKGRESVDEIQRLNDEIPDFKMSAQIKQLEILTERIFAFVEQNPDNLRQIRQFLNYYLPTTIKLLGQYVTLQNQGMRIGNIDEGMKKIEEMLDKIIVAFQKQLDSLFESSVVDITADIQVMEKMMASEGLTNEKDF